MPEPTAANPLPDAEAWFAHRGWVPFPFQREVSQGKVNAESGVLHANTGKGKTEPGRINHHDGGCGVYWNAPDGHYLGIITRPYGSRIGSEGYAGAWVFQRSRPAGSSWPLVTASDSAAAVAQGQPKPRVQATGTRAVPAARQRGRPAVSSAACTSVCVPLLSEWRGNGHRSRVHDGRSIRRTRIWLRAVASVDRSLRGEYQALMVRHRFAEVGNVTIVLSIRRCLLP